MAQIDIMVAEDEIAIRAGIRKMVEDFMTEKDHKYTISEAADGTDALRKCTEKAPDILITDIKMPGSSGISLIKTLTQNQICSNILVISGYQDYEYIRDAMKSGTYDYLLKPIKKSQLWEALEHLTQKLPGNIKLTEDVTMSKTISFMEENFTSNIQLAHVAEAVFLHPNYLSALFSKKMGLTFRDYLRTLRINHAKKLIQETNLSVNEIAEQSGFKDSTHFFRVFKSVTGVTPRKYKQITINAP